MKKINGIALFAAAVLGATVAAAPASAATLGTISSHIDGMQFWIGQTDVLSAPGGYISNIAFGGTAYDADDDHYIDNAQVNLSGDIGFNYNSNHYVLSFYLKGTFVPQNGIIFDDGYLTAETNYDFGGIYSPLDGSPPIYFLSDPSGAINSAHQPTTGVVADLLPGFWDGQIGSASYGKGVGSLDGIFGLYGIFFIDGYITAHANDQSEWMTFGQPSVVPVPAAAWLFGSGLAGLAMAGRRRRN